jgi:hypothetical protein
MRFVFVILVLVAACHSADAETYAVTGVTGADRVVLQYRGLPVNLALSHLEVPTDSAAQRACQERLSALVKDKKVDVVYDASFGAASDGAARVQLLANGQNVNEQLVLAGLARYRAAAKVDPLYDDKIKRAEDKARAAKSGIWAAAAPATAATQPPAVNADKLTNVKAVAPTGPFCSELDSKFYYHTGDAAVANVHAQRLIFYADEAAAKRAGKSANPAPAASAAPGDGSESAGDKIFAQGKDLYAQAQAKGNTSDRDVLYEKAYTILSQAMNIYGALVEKRPDDERLAEKLRECMQLRYGSIKQRRF